MHSIECANTFSRILIMSIENLFQNGPENKQERNRQLIEHLKGKKNGHFNLFCEALYITGQGKIIHELISQGKIISI